MNRIASSLVLIAVALVFLITAQNYSPNSRAVPVAVALVTLALLALDIASQGEGKLGHALRRALGGVQAVRPGADAEAGEPRKEFAAFLWVVGFAAGTVLVGFYIAIPVYVVGYLRLYARKPLLHAIAIAAVLTGALYLLFAVLLGYGIFEGLLFGGFM